MFAFVISLFVIGAGVIVATRVVLSEAPKSDKPATRRRTRGRVAPSPSRPGPQRVAESETDVVMLYEPVTPSPWRRLRSGVLLVSILTVLGALVALLVVIVGAILLTGLRTAVQ